jgi:hypothetical protein
MTPSGDIAHGSAVSLHFEVSMRSPFRFPGALVVLLTLSACDATTMPSDGSLSADESRLLAVEIEAAGSAVLESASMLRSTTFSHVRQCPLGGSVNVTGSVTGERDLETRTATMQVTTTNTHAACALGRGPARTITITGSPSVVFTANRKLVNGLPNGPQTTRKVGGFTYTTSGGGSGSCQIDVTSSFDPATGAFTMKGTNCGRSIDVAVTRPG